MRKIIIASCMILLSSTLSADTVNVEDFLSSDSYQGAISCDTVYKNGEELIAVFEKPQLPSKLAAPQKIKFSCAAGGGDCLCYILYFDSFKGFYQVYNQDKSKLLWIQGTDAQPVSLEKLIQPSGDELKFRSPMPSVYADKEQKKAIPFSESTIVSPLQEKLILKDHPLPVGVVNVPTPRPDAKATMIVSSLKKTGTAKEYKLSEQIDFLFDSQLSKPRDHIVMAKEGNRYLIVTEFFSNAENYSTIKTGRYAFWIEFKNTPVTYTEKKFSLTESPLYSGLVYKVKSLTPVAEIEIFVQMDRILENAETPDEDGSHLFILNTIYIPVKDEKGRLNFVLIDNEGC